MAARYIPHAEKILLNLYALIAAGTVLCVLPFSLLPYAGLACITVGFIAAYVYRWRNRYNSLVQTHTTHIIHTMWWSMLILLIGIFMFACILVYNGDLSAIYNMMQEADKGIIVSEEDVRLMQITFVQINKKLILIAGAIALLPYPLYIFARVIKGVRSIKKAG